MGLIERNLVDLTAVLYFIVKESLNSHLVLTFSSALISILILGYLKVELCIRTYLKISCTS